MVMMQRQPDPTINDFGISRGRIVILKQTSVRCDSKPAFTQHHKGAKCRDIIGVEVEQLTVQIAHDGYQKFAGWKFQLMRLEADYGGTFKSGNVYLKNGRDYVIE
jgi:hypothetical protein